MNAQRNNDEEEVKQFISDSLRIQLPEGSLQDILKDGIILCEYVYDFIQLLLSIKHIHTYIYIYTNISLIRVFSPDGFIVKNEGKTKFAYVG